MPNTTDQENLLAIKGIISEFNGVTPGWYSMGNDAWGGMDKPNQLTADQPTVYNWMNGATLEKLTQTGDIYTATLESGGKQEEIAWTTGKSEKFETSGYSNYETLFGGKGNLTGTIELNGSPILLES